MNKKIIFSLLAWSLASTAFADDCSQYPYFAGLDLRENGSIVATSAVSVNFDDVDSQMEARAEAEIAAKALLAKFMSEAVTSSTLIEKLAETSIKRSGGKDTAERQSTKRTLMKLGNSTSALLRGVLVIGSCHTPKKEVRVTVGIKPETIAQAEKLAGEIGDSVNRVATPQPGTASTSARGDEAGVAASSVSGGTTTLPKSSGYSDTKRLSNF